MKVQPAAFLRTTLPLGLDQIDQLEGIVQKNPPPSGEPNTWNSLVSRRVLRGLPVDPVGTPFILDPVTGRVRVAEQSPLHPMPEEPRRLQ